MNFLEPIIEYLLLFLPTARTMFGLAPQTSATRLGIAELPWKLSKSFSKATNARDSHDARRIGSCKRGAIHRFELRGLPFCSAVCSLIRANRIRLTSWM